MKKYLPFTVLILLMLLLCGCAAGEAVPPETQGLSIVATNFPAYDFARTVVGEKGSVTLLVPPGAESHSFEPTAQDILRINRCDLLIRNGGESEAWMDEIADALDENVRILTMLDCVDALEEEIKEGMQSHDHDHDHDHEDHDHGEEPEYDEHVWTSPVNAAKICRAICRELSEADTENAAYYTENTVNYCRELSELDEAFRSVCESASRDVLIFADRFPVRYFVEEYGLDYYAAFPGCADDAEPSAKTVAFLIDRVREANIPAVLYIEFSNEKMADVICEDTFCRKLLFHSCHNVSAEDLKNGVTYLELMWKNVESVKEALS